jgi:DNA-binding LacI/PurR family transcriptional regulator
MPVVVVGRPDVEGVSYVDVDNYGGARDIASFLCDSGYRRIGLIGAPTDTTAGLDRLSGFVEGLAARGLALDPKLRVDGDFTHAGGYAAMQQLLAHRPEAVFAASDAMAMGAMRAAREAGVAIPHDVALVGFDGSQASETSNPPLTTVAQDVYGTGSRAVDVLNRLVSRSEDGPIVDVQPVELIVRASTADHRVPQGA